MPVPADFVAPPVSGGKQWDPLPEDTFQWEIFDVSPDKDTEFKTNKEIDVWKFELVVLDKDYDFEGDLNGTQFARGRRVWPKLKMVCSPPNGEHSPSHLYRLARAVYGRDLTKAECDAIRTNPTPLLHKQIKMGVTVVESKAGKLYNKPMLGGITKANKPLPLFDPETEGFGKKAGGSAVSADDDDFSDVPF
jgi:hypothetical protein